MRSRLLPDLGLAPSPDTSKFDMLATAFLNVAEIMRHHEVETFGEEIGTLYAVITGNEYLLSTLNTSNTHPVVRLRQEMSAFIDTRIKYIVESFVSHVKKHFALFEDCIVGASNKLISDDGITSLHGIQFIEFEVLRICDRMLQYERLDVYDTNITEHEQYDMKGILCSLIKKFDAISSRLLMPTQHTTNARIIDRNDNDLASTRGIVILGYLIARVVVCMLFTRGCDNISYIADKEQQQKDLVGDEYAKYSNLGSLRFSSMLCCFKYTKLLEMAVVNKSGHLTTVEKTFLLNMLIMSKLA